MRVLVTGSAGFIGFHLSKRLLALGHEVAGLDAITPYYDVRLKQARHHVLAQYPRFRPIIGRLEDRTAVEAAFADAPDVVVHLAAQAGVRHSLSFPEEYIDTNVAGTLAILEACRRQKPTHLLVASSSSVYGMSDHPSKETDNTDRPTSLYAATKKATEAITHSYAHLFEVPTTCMRFFTVYGPYGRPDMALFKFAEAIAKNQAIEVFGEGRITRDFTYIDDLIVALTLLATRKPQVGAPVSADDTLSLVAPWRVVNVAGGRPVELMDFISALESALGKTAPKRMLPMQQGDVAGTAGDTSLLLALVGQVPATTVTDGVRAFVEWHRAWTNQ